MWVKADAGITPIANSFISQFVLIGAGSESANGTYTRASGGTTSFVNSNGSTLEYDNEDPYWNWILYGEDDDENVTGLYIISIQTYSGVEYFEDSDTLSGTPNNPSAQSVTNTPTGAFSVQDWLDQSGNNRNLEYQGSNLGFTPSAINSKPAVYFNGPDVMIGTNFGFNLANDNTIFVVFKPSSATGNHILVNQGAGELGLAITNGYTQISSSYVIGLATSTAASSINTPYIFTSRNSSYNFTIYLNGTQTGSAYGDGLDEAQTNLYVGAIDGGAGYEYFYTGYISEIIIYNRAVTTAERQQVHAYLGTKYAITVA